MLKTVLVFLIIALSSALFAAQPSTRPLEADAVWMKIYVQGQSDYVYIDLSKDGSALYRDETFKSIATRSGKLPERVVKDIMQELDNSEVFESSKDSKAGHMLFFKGKMLQISYYRRGQLMSATLPMAKLSGGLVFAVEAAQKSAARLLPLGAQAKLVIAEPEQEAAAPGAVSGDFARLETEEIEKVEPLMQAILKPKRLVPLNDASAQAKLGRLIAERKIKSAAGEFKLATSRGKFNCKILPAAR